MAGAPDPRLAPELTESIMTRIARLCGEDAEEMAAAPLAR